MQTPDEIALFSGREQSASLPEFDQPSPTDAELRAVADAIPHLVWSLRPDGSCRYFNQKWVDYTGVPAAMSVARGLPGFIHPDDIQRAAGLCIIMPGGSASAASVDCECRLRRADGAYRWMLGRLVPQRDASGNDAGWTGTFTDIDDMKRAAEAVERNLYMSRVASHCAHLGGWAIELPERKLTWSDECCLIHDCPPGYQPTLDEGIGYFPEEHRATIRRLVEACAREGTPYEFTLPKVTAKGRKIWVRSLGEAVRDGNGRIVRLQGAFQDVTAQKLTEARMQALEAQLTTTIESISDGFFILDKEWKFLFINAPAEQLLRRTRDSLLGKTLWSELTGMAGSAVHSHFFEAATERRTVRFEHFYAPLGAWMSVRAYPAEVGLAVYFEDITERRQQEAQLHLLETAVARTNDIVVIMEADAAEPEAGPHIVFVNDAFARLTGYGLEQAVGKTPMMLWGARTNLVELDRVRNAMKSWQPARAEMVAYSSTGRELWLEIDVAPIAAGGGRFTHWVAVGRDITERRQQKQLILNLNSELEDRVLRRTEQLAAANRELESFAYSVSHDLRSPLNTVHGFAQLLTKIDAGNLSEKGRYYLDRVGAGAKQMGDLIEGLLTLADLTRDAIKLEPLDLSGMARSIERDLRLREPHREVELVIEDHLKAEGDPRLIYAVLHNLLGNAWKFTAKRQVARIQLGRELMASGEWCFCVRDNGAGFDMAFVHKLFGIFERLHSPGDFPGAGIGLATVQRVIERHGGNVWAEGTVGGGANFYFTMVTSRAATQPTDARTPGDGHMSRY